MILEWSWFIALTIISMWTSFLFIKDDEANEFFFVIPAFANAASGLISINATFHAFFLWMEDVLPQHGTQINWFTAAVLAWLLYIAYFASTFLCGFCLNEWRKMPRTSPSRALVEI